MTHQPKGLSRTDTYADTIATDAAWQEFWMGALSDPTADMIRSGIYANMMGD